MDATDPATLDDATVKAGLDVLTGERRHLDRAEQALHHMRGAAGAIADFGVDALAAEALGRLRAERLAALARDPGTPAFFGRIDTVGDFAERPETFHIGRRHLRDEHGDPVVVDWRAPVARAFYRASPTDPLGIRRRRRFGFAGLYLTSYEDENLDVKTPATTSQLVRREIERPREGPMRDIVATIAPDQDDLVRAELGVSLCIQGAPGTGKTAVGLHRAAYLLYTYPARLQRAGVLVVGPNRAFLRYIEAVLPTLGEGGIRQTTVDELVAPANRPSGRQGRPRARPPQPGPHPEPAAVAVLKGDLRLADALARAVLTHVAKPVDDVLVVGGPLATGRYRIPVERLRRYVDDARRETAAGTVRWSVARERLRTRLAHDVRRQREDVGGAPSEGETTAVGRLPGVTAFLDAVWPALTPAAVLEGLYRDAELRRRCLRHLDDAGQAALAWPPGPARWTAADAVLLDELAGLIDGAETFAHVVVDEAQDLSPMQCRVLARRCPTGSFTVLGDLAQATTAWAPGDWAATLVALGCPDAQVRPLTVGYRVPAAVLTLTNQLLPLIAPQLRPATSLRDGTEPVRYVARRGLVDAVTDLLAAPGSVGVIGPDVEVDTITAGLVAAGLAVAAGDDEGRLWVVPATTAKGLEFDGVVVVEPAAIAAAEPTTGVGLRRLYVVLTRAVSRLVVCHDEPLPAGLVA